MTTSKAYYLYHYTALQLIVILLHGKCNVVGVVFRPENEKEGMKCPNEDTVSKQK